MKAELRKAVHDCSSRGLSNAAKWAAELAVSVPASTKTTEPTETIGMEDDYFLLAKSYFDCKEYYRAANVLKHSTEKTPKAFFLKNYSLFLAGEKRKSEEKNEVGERCPVENRELKALRDQLEPLYEGDKLDSFCLYLYGVVLRELCCIVTAREVFAKSLRLYPVNWSCWQDLIALVEDTKLVRQLGDNLPVTHWTHKFFLSSVYLELQDVHQAKPVLTNLLQLYPQSNFLLALDATLKYNMQDWEEAEKSFEKLLEEDPCRLANMDTYSNILFVTESHAKLSNLAYKASITDKYTPETCAIIGNYYSLKGDRPRAVTYFNRALKLNSSYLQAWTLMGHEYVEMKNANAAIAAYRKAVDLNPRDYRSWYGLGQAYELLGMPLYAQYYYGKACALRPYDSRMWCALAECYEKVGNITNAIKAYQRAEANNDREGLALKKLARLFKSEKKLNMAALYYHKNLSRQLTIANSSAPSSNPVPSTPTPTTSNTPATTTTVTATTTASTVDANTTTNTSSTTTTTTTTTTTSTATINVIPSTPGTPATPATPSNLMLTPATPVTPAKGISPARDLGASSNLTTISDPEMKVEALLFLAKFYKDLPGGGPVALQRAEQYCSLLLDIPGKEKDEAKAIWHEIWEKKRSNQ